MVHEENDQMHEWTHFIPILTPSEEKYILLSLLLWQFRTFWGTLSEIQIMLYLKIFPSWSLSILPAREGFKNCRISPPHPPPPIFEPYPVCIITFKMSKAEVSKEKNTSEKCFSLANFRNSWNVHLFWILPVQKACTPVSGSEQPWMARNNCCKRKCNCTVTASTHQTLPWINQIKHYEKGKNSHQQGKSLPLLIHSSSRRDGADWVAADQEDLQLVVASSLACTWVQLPDQEQSAFERAQRWATVWHFPRARTTVGPSLEDHQLDGFHPKYNQLDWAWLEVSGRGCRCPQKA